MKTLAFAAKDSKLGTCANWLLKGSALVAITSVFGYKFFTLNPELLAKFDWAMELYPHSYKVSAQAQITLCFLATLAFLIDQLKWRWLAAFIGVYALSFFSEFSGTSWGLPFGHYEYTDLLGFKLLNKVPWLIPTSWFFMGLASFRIAVAMLGPAGKSSLLRGSLLRCVVATALLLLWDVTLDPAMSHTTPFWVWEQPGSYYGMPALNIFGWAVTGFLIMMVIEKFFGYESINQLPTGFLAGLYGTNLILPLGLLAAVGAWPPICITIALGWLVYRFSRVTGSSKFFASERMSGGGLVSSGPAPSR